MTCAADLSGTHGVLATSLDSVGDRWGQQEAALPPVSATGSTSRARWSNCAAPRPFPMTDLCGHSSGRQSLVRRETYRAYTPALPSYALYAPSAFMAESFTRLLECLGDHAGPWLHSEDTCSATRRCRGNHDDQSPGQAGRRAAFVRRGTCQSPPSNPVSLAFHAWLGFREVAILAVRDSRIVSLLQKHTELAGCSRVGMLAVHACFGHEARGGFHERSGGLAHRRTWEQAPAHAVREQTPSGALDARGRRWTRRPTSGPGWSLGLIERRVRAAAGRGPQREAARRPVDRCSMCGPDARIRVPMTCLCVANLRVTLHTERDEKPAAARRHDSESELTAAGIGCDAAAARRSFGARRTVDTCREVFGKVSGRPAGCCTRMLWRASRYDEGRLAHIALRCQADFMARPLRAGAKGAAHGDACATGQSTSLRAPGDRQTAAPCSGFGISALPGQRQGALARSGFPGRSQCAPARLSKA